MRLGIGSFGLGRSGRAGMTPALRAAQASLDLDFLKQRYTMNLLTKAFAEIFTFTRASGGGRINSSGVYEWVAANQPRFDYEPVDVPILGAELLGAITGDGATLSGGVLTENSATSSHGLAIATPYKGAFSYSVRAKAGTKNFLWLYFANYNNGSAWFNLSTGAVSAVETGVSASISASGDGYYTCTLTKTTGNSSNNVGCYAAASSGSTSYAGSGAAALSIDTISVKEITGYAVRKGDPKGILIEEQRTNEITYSSDFTSAAWSKIASTVSPGFTGIDGSNGASKIVETTANSNHGIARASWVDHRNGSACASIFAKAAERTAFAMWLDDGSGKGITAKFDLVAQTATITRTDAKFSVMKCALYPASNGFFRCVLAVKNTDITGVGTWGQMRLYLDKPGGTSDGFGSVMYAGDGTSGLIIQAAQEETGDFETSYIPTTTAQVTRAAELLILNSLSPWYAANGTFIFEGDSNGITGAGSILIGGGNASNFYIDPSRKAVYWAGSGPTIQAPNSHSAGSVFKAGMAYSAAGVAVCQNSGAVVSNAQTIASNTSFGIGAALSGALYLNGHVRKLRYFPRRLADAQLQAITA